MRKNLLFDMHHLLHRTFFSITEKLEDEDMVALALHKAIMSMNKFHKKFMPNNVVCVFDGHSWRKDYTNSDSCITIKKYKANRRKDLTEHQIIQYNLFDNHIEYFKGMLKEKTGILVLEHPNLEADDIIGGWVENFQEDTNVIITGDNDFLQLLKYSNVTIYDPIQDKAKDLSEYDFDADYFMFEKCFRGDTGDWVMSSYPRIRKDKIKKAYTDDFTLVNVMEHTFELDHFDENGELKIKKFKTADVFRENLLLMDLTCQPDNIKKLIREIVNTETRSRYNMIEFMRFCSSIGLQNISENMTAYTGLLLGRR